MTRDEVRALPAGTPIEDYQGLRAGEQAIVYGWRGPGTQDLRTIKRIERSNGPSQTCVMVYLDRALTNGSYKVDAGWLFKTGDPRRSGE